MHTNRQAFDVTKSSADPDIQFNKHQFKVLLTRSRKREEKEDMTWGEIGSFCSLSLHIIEDLPNMHLGESVSVHPSLSLSHVALSNTHTRERTHTNSLYFSLLCASFPPCLNQLAPTVHSFFSSFCLRSVLGPAWACMSACVCLYICVHVWADVCSGQSHMSVPDSSMEMWDKLKNHKRTSAHIQNN